jgi:hypothetical protein
VNFLLPRTVLAVVTRVQPVDIHGDRWVDVALASEEPGEPALAGRIAANECPEALAPGERVEARVVMGNLVGLKRAAP